MQTANIFAIVAGALWGWIAWTGVDNLKNVVMRGLAPDPGQIDALIGTPVVVVASVGAITLLTNIMQRHWKASHFASGAAIFAFIPYLFALGGGG